MVKMTKQLALKTILVISVVGILFSGFLSYKELTTGPGACSAAAAGTICSLLGIPVCVYGLIMYILVLLLSLAGLKSKK
jgi:uncharacterized membrane protein